VRKTPGRRATRAEIEKNVSEKRGGKDPERKKKKISYAGGVKNPGKSREHYWEDGL